VFANQAQARKRPHTITHTHNHTHTPTHTPTHTHNHIANIYGLIDLGFEFRWDKKFFVCANGPERHVVPSSLLYNGHCVHSQG